MRDGVRKGHVPLAAVDGTGLESRHPAGTAFKRRSRSGDRDQITTYAKFPKVVFVVDCTSHMILAAVPGRGPGSDLVQFDAAVWSRPSAVLRSRLFWRTRTSTPSGSTAASGRMAFAPSSRRRAGDRHTSHQRATGGGG